MGDRDRKRNIIEYIDIKYDQCGLRGTSLEGLQVEGKLELQKVLVNILVWDQKVRPSWADKNRRFGF